MFDPYDDVFGDPDDDYDPYDGEEGRIPLSTVLLVYAAGVLALLTILKIFYNVVKIVLDSAGCSV